MSQRIDERLQSTAPEEPKASARVLPFERPPSDLQRAVQQRAQESLERSRERAKTKPAPLKWALTFLLALVPVLLLVAGIDAFVRVFHKINDTYSKMPVPAPAETQAPNAQEPVVQQPGIVILESVPQSGTSQPPNQTVPTTPNAPQSAGEKTD